jgi:hypothetical protein
VLPTAVARPRMKHAAAPRRGTPRGTTAARAIPVDDRRGARKFSTCNVCVYTRSVRYSCVLNFSTRMTPYLGTRTGAYKLCV